MRELFNVILSLLHSAHIVFERSFLVAENFSTPYLRLTTTPKENFLTSTPSSGMRGVMHVHSSLSYSIQEPSHDCFNRKTFDRDKIISLEFWPSSSLMMSFRVLFCRLAVVGCFEILKIASVQIFFD